MYVFLCLCTRTKESCLLTGELVACGFCTLLITFLASCCYVGGLGVLQSAMVQVTEAYVM